MNCIAIIEKLITTKTVDNDLYISKKDNKKYRFIKPASLRYQGEFAYYKDIETGKIRLLYSDDLESLAKIEPLIKVK